MIANQSTGGLITCVNSTETWGFPGREAWSQLSATRCDKDFETPSDIGLKNRLTKVAQPAGATRLEIVWLEYFSVKFVN